MDSTIRHAGDIIKRYKEIWMKLEHVTGVGTGKARDGRICIIISLENDEASTRDIFPAEIEGVPIEIKISGKIDASQNLL